MKRITLNLIALAMLISLNGCMGAQNASLSGLGGEVVGVSGKNFSEPVPYGMVKVERGFLRMGLEKHGKSRKRISTNGIRKTGFIMGKENSL